MAFDIRFRLLVRRAGRTFIDPFADERDLGGLEEFSFASRRHARRAARNSDVIDDQTLRTVARFENGAGLAPLHHQGDSIHAQAVHLLEAAVARIAVGRQNGFNALQIIDAFLAAQLRRNHCE